MRRHHSFTRAFGAALLVAGVALAANALLVRGADASFFDDVRRFLTEPFPPASEVPPPAPSADAVPQAERPPITPDTPLSKPTADYEEAVVRAVENASRSVVSIVVTKDLPVIERCPYDPWSEIPPEFRDFFGGGFTRPCERGTRREEVGGGSGFVVSANGLVVTNKHVVSDAKAEYTVLTNDGKRFDATVLARDPSLDLALLEVRSSGLVPVALGDSDRVKLGQTAIAIGNSLGEFRNTVSVGVVSGLARTITASGASYGDETLRGLIQTDAAINPGNSGGPLLNLRGEVIGINTAVAAGAENIGFTIPINQAKRAIESVKRSGRIVTPYLGVRYLTLNEDLAKQQRVLVTEGALVRGTADGPGVLPDSPAARAGLEAEDVITALGGEQVTSDTPLGELVSKRVVGEAVTLTVRRGDRTLTLSATLAERPAGEYASRQGLPEPRGPRVREPAH